MKDIVTRIRISSAEGRIPSDQIRAWQENQVKPTAVFMRKASGRKDIAPYDSLEIADLKYKVSEADLNAALAKSLKKSNSNLGINDGRKHRIAFIEAEADGITCETLLDTARKLLGGPDANKLFISLNPAHYQFKADEKQIEIIETLMPEELPTRYVLKFGEEKGLKSKTDESFTIHLCACAHLPSGKRIGGLRIELKDQDDHACIRYTGEFASYITDEELLENRMHMACELHQMLIRVLQETA
ncbi:MAG: hypothetical protein LKF79_03440 [Solobacterium sp.]|jgi:hypothetical protein|nr:hypothetical protein [Solobacterium sp.]MCH4223085.1 hypothetical protein [Solobacterium sp.]MCH4265679.1 hypothetical protein [Solobacterium sp.]